MDQEYFKISKIQGIEMEALLIRLKMLISSKKITDNLPDNFNDEIDKINDKINNLYNIEELYSSMDGGNYLHNHNYIKYVQYDTIAHALMCDCGNSIIEDHAFIISSYDTYHKNTCEKCGYVKVIPHKYDDEFAIKIDDTNHSKTCECGHVLIEAHKWDEGKITLAATHTKDGIKTYTCIECTATRTDVVPASSDKHTFGKWTKLDDNNHSRECECGEIETAVHNWNDGVVTIQPTHTEEGVKTLTCFDCGAIKTEIVDKISEHSYGGWVQSDDINHKKVCECGDIITESHVWDNGAVTVVPTTTSNGVMTYTCEVCGYVKNEEIPKLSSKISYIGSITPLSVGREGLAATTVGDHALFAGGIDWGTFYSTIDAYNGSLTKISPSPALLSESRSGLVSESIGNYALFSGGVDGLGTSSTVDAYNESLTKISPSPTPLSDAKYSLTVTAIGDYVLFAGGINNYNALATVDAYNSSLTKFSQSPLSVAKSHLASTTIGDYALFAGGYNPNNTENIATVDAYTKSLTKVMLSIPSLSVGRRGLASTAIGDYALFAGGRNNTMCLDIVDVYDKSLTKLNSTSLNVARSELTSTTIGDYALFAGGTDSDYIDHCTADIYDKSLTRIVLVVLSVGRSNLVSTTIGDHVLFAGGYISNGDQFSSDVDVCIYTQE